jgi:hypothetical protein
VGISLLKYVCTDYRANFEQVESFWETTFGGLLWKVCVKNILKEMQYHFGFCNSKLDFSKSDFLQLFTSGLLWCEEEAKPLEAPSSHLTVFYKGLLQGFLTQNESSIRREYEMMVLQRAEINELLFLEVRLKTLHYLFSSYDFSSPPIFPLLSFSFFGLSPLLSGGGQ